MAGLGASAPQAGRAGQSRGGAQGHENKFSRLTGKIRNPANLKDEEVIIMDNPHTVTAMRAIYITLATVLDRALGRPIEQTTSAILRGAVDRGSFDGETAEILKRVTDVGD
jgi:hypothetical protein